MSKHYFLTANNDLTRQTTLFLHDIRKLSGELSNDGLYDVLQLHVEFADIYTSTVLLLSRKSI